MAIFFLSTFSSSRISISSNCSSIVKLIIKLLDVDKGFKDSDYVIEKEYTMPMVHQGYIEPHDAVAQWGEDGRLT